MELLFMAIGVLVILMGVGLRIGVRRAPVFGRPEPTWDLDVPFYIVGGSLFVVGLGALFLY
jgi:hypothetical protein